MNDLDRDIARNILKEDPEMEGRISRGIEENRKGSGTIKVIGTDGKPMNVAKVTFRQTRHEFRFGCNAFMINQVKGDEKGNNAAYGEAFANGFNLAVRRARSTRSR